MKTVMLIHCSDACLCCVMIGLAVMMRSVDCCSDVIEFLAVLLFYSPSIDWSMSAASSPALLIGYIQQQFSCFSSALPAYIHAVSIYQRTGLTCWCLGTLNTAITGRAVANWVTLTVNYSTVPKANGLSNLTVTLKHKKMSVAKQA